MKTKKASHRPAAQRTLNVQRTHPSGPAARFGKRANRHAQAPAVAPGKSGIHGRGLFAIDQLPGRRKLGELHGVLVKLPEARRAVEQNGEIYLIELSRRYALDCSASNEFRFLNHSCEPNCYLRVFRRRVEVYTTRPIPAGSELTVDYGLTPHKGGMTCRCGAQTCRSRL